MSGRDDELQLYIIYGMAINLILKEICLNSIKLPQILLFKQFNKTMNLVKLILLSTIVSLTIQAEVYFTPCPQSSGRNCPSSTNRTDFLLSMKKGGTNILSTSTYLYDFFLCEEYNYDCGYMPDSQSYVTVANGVSLDINATQLADITSLTATENKIKPYIGARGDSARCGMVLFPLQLTPVESKEVLDGYMTVLNTQVSTYYNLDRNASVTQAWSAININIRTAVLEKLKANTTMIRNSTLWTKLVANQYTEVAKELKGYYTQYDEQIDLHAAYLIDSVTQKCNKLQSVNFLVDQSGSIGASGFQLALDFLKMYVNSTNDDLSIMSIHFYDNNYDQYITYGHNKSYFMSMIPAKPYRAMGTLTGKAINETVNRIVANGFKNGIPKILVVMTDGVSYDSITEAAKYARDKQIIPIAVGIGSNVDATQLLQIAGTPSNYIQISSYADLPKLVEFISNYFCKQIITIQLGEEYVGNFVRVPQSPSYFRVIKSPGTEGQYYELDIAFESDPIAHQHEVVQSQIDPFPDEYTEYTNAEFYEIYNESALASGLRAEPQLGAAFVPRKIYFIEPEHEVTYVVKKSIEETMNVTVSYVSIKGVNLGFNISLKVCTTRQCDVERAYYQSILNRKTKDSVIVVPPEEDLSIFIVIGSTLVVLAALCILFIFACRKFNKEEEQKTKGTKLNLNETVPTDQNIEGNFVPEQTNGRTAGDAIGQQIMPTQTDSRLHNKKPSHPRKSNKGSRKGDNSGEKHSRKKSKSPKHKSESNSSKSSS